jgi:hypothetical protein
MKKIVSLFMLTGTLLMAEYSYSNSGAASAFKDLDCEFEDCTPKTPEVKVVEKRILIIKEVPVQKIVEKEVIKEVPVEKIVYREKPSVENESHETVKKPKIEKKELVTSDITFNKAFFDVHPKTQAPIQDYIEYTKRGSFDVSFFIDTINKIKESADAYIYGKILVPDSISTDEVYMYVGENYLYNYYSYWNKNISYNNGNSQNSDYFLAKVQTDNKGRRYISYKITIHLDRPWDIKPAEKNVAPNTYFFTMAPKERGFKTKFTPVKVYILND